MWHQLKEVKYSYENNVEHKRARKRKVASRMEDVQKIINLMIHVLGKYYNKTVGWSVLKVCPMIPKNYGLIL